MSDIKVSICCQTYNHVNYIEECINGFLMQKTNFIFEILLRDDASTDGTTKIVKEYSDKYPEIINPLIYTENQFKKGIKPFRDNVSRAKGKYIALCEGDDYWTDPYKLQKQVDFLEANEEYGLSFHNVEYIIENKFEKKKPLNEVSFSCIDLAFKGCFINTCSVVLRNIEKEHPRPGYYNQLTTGDYALFLHQSKYGKIHYLPDCMAVYRKHTGGTWSIKKDFDMYCQIAKNLKLFVQNESDPELINGFIEQNRNNFKFVLFELLQNSDWDKINEIRELSKFDPKFDTFLLDYVVRKHLELMENSRFNKLKKYLKG